MTQNIKILRSTTNTPSTLAYGAFALSLTGGKAHLYIGDNFNNAFELTAASNLSGTTLASNVTASSLTSLGTLTSLTLNGNIYDGSSVEVLDATDRLLYDDSGNLAIDFASRILKDSAGGSQLSWDPTGVGLPLVTASRVLGLDSGHYIVPLTYGSANTNSSLVQRDSSGNFSAATISASGVNVSGLTASQTVVTDSSKNLASLAYTSSNTSSTLVERDGSGNFSAGTVTATLAGNASTASTAVQATKLQTARTIGGVSFDGQANIVPQTIQMVDESSDTSCFVLFGNDSGSASQQPKTNTALTFDASIGQLAAMSFFGAMFTSLIKDSSSLTAIDVNSRALFGPAGTGSPLTWDDTQLIFTGSLQANWGDPTLSSRIYFQDSSTNPTFLNVVPAVTATEAGAIFFNGGDLDNSSYLKVGADASSCYIDTTISGTGTQNNLEFRYGGSALLILTSDSLITSSGTSLVTSLLKDSSANTAINLDNRWLINSTGTSQIAYWNDTGFGLAANLYGDWGGSTYIQNVSSSASTSVNIIPGGGVSDSFVQLFSQPDPANSEVLKLGMPGSGNAYIDTTLTGGGTQRSLEIKIAGTAYNIFRSNGNFSMSANLTDSSDNIIIQPFARTLVSPSSYSILEWDDSGVNVVTGTLKLNTIDVQQVLATGAGTPNEVIGLQWQSQAFGSTIVYRDSDANFGANNIALSVANVTSAVGTTSMTPGSAHYQRLTGLVAQTFVLPDATGLLVGISYTFINKSVGVLSLQDNSAGALITATTGQWIIVVLMGNGSAAGDWEYKVI